MTVLETHYDDDCYDENGQFVFDGEQTHPDAALRQASTGLEAQKLVDGNIWLDTLNERYGDLVKSTGGTPIPRFQGGKINDYIKISRKRDDAANPGEQEDE